MQSPNHYKDTRLMDLLIDRKVPFAEGNIMKYVFRWEEKDGLKDLYKARDYLNALITSTEIESKRAEPIAGMQICKDEMVTKFRGAM